MTDDLDTRLKAAVSEREKLTAESQRIAGRKEAAEKALRTVEAEIRAKNLDPDTLDETVKKLNTAYSEAVSKLEMELQAARESLIPYQETK